jgi:hypothetical protein
MVDIRQIGGDSLSTILEESTGSIVLPMPLPTHTKRSSQCFTPSFEGAIFAISANEPSHKGEMDQERAAWVERNADRMAHRVE